MDVSDVMTSYMIRIFQTTSLCFYVCILCTAIQSINGRKIVKYVGYYIRLYWIYLMSEEMGQPHLHCSFFVHWYSNDGLPYSESNKDTGLKLL